jgi:hypothetical protein
MPADHTQAWYIRSVPPGRRYSDREVEAILRRAIEEQVEAGDKLGHEELVAAAMEVGLDEDAVERAIAELGDERSDAQIRASLKSRRRHRWLRHLVLYLTVAGGLLGLHALALTGAWVYWLAFGWGIPIALGAFNGLRDTTDEEVAGERKRMNRKERRRAEAEARRESKRRREEEKAQERARREQRRHKRSRAEDELEHVIEEGVGLLLAAAARKLREAAEENRPKTDFDRYVARKKAEARGEPAKREEAEPRAHARVRVEEEEPVDAEIEEEEEEARGRKRRHR